MKNEEIEKMYQGGIFYFNAWKYDIAENPLLGFLEEFRRSMKIENTRNVKDKIIKAAKFTKNTSKMLSFIPGISGVATGITALSEIVETSLAEEEILTIQDAQEVFKSLVKLCFKDNDSGKVLIIIDELERCKPDFALFFLEAIKNIMSIPEIDYIIAFDPDYLKNAVRHFYGYEINPSDYLRKFFRTGYHLKPLSRESYSLHINTKSTKNVKGERESAGWEILKILVATAGSATNCDLRTVTRFLVFFESSFYLQENKIFDLEVFTVENQLHLKAYLYVSIFLLIYRDPKFIHNIKLEYIKQETVSKKFEVIKKEFIKNQFKSIDNIDHFFKIFTIEDPEDYFKNDWDTMAPEVMKKNHDYFHSFFKDLILSSFQENRSERMPSGYKRKYPLINAIIASIERSVF